MRNYTKIPNEVLGPSQLSLQARYLLCVLLKYCGKDEWCYPSQQKLATDMSVSARHIRNLLVELEAPGLILKKRRGWNRSNTYSVAKSFRLDRNGVSYQLGNVFPFHNGSVLPPKSTYLKGKGKRSIKGFEQMRENLIRKGLLGKRY